MNFTETLLKRAEEYCTATGATEGTLGVKAVNNSRLFDRLRAGRSCTLETYNRVMRFIDEALTDSGGQGGKDGGM